MSAAALSPRAPPADAPVLAVEGLGIRITAAEPPFTVVADMALAVRPGETLCLVGESGCGKSMTALALLRLLPEGAGVAAGSIRLEGADLLALPEAAAEDLRGNRIAMIFQEPLTALNPVMRVGSQIAEALRRHRRLSRRAAWAVAVNALRSVEMPDPERRARDYPHQLSGGQRQRAMIALALSCEPAVLVADEPTTALDVTVQAQILGLMRDLQRRSGTALVLITHDLGVVAEMADRVIVMYAGRRVEEAAVTDLFDTPLHPYTRGLMGAIPGAAPSARGPAAEGPGAGAGGAAIETAPPAAPPASQAAAGLVRGRLADIPGTVPPLWALPAGCAFAPRCPLATDRCRAERPPLEEHRPGHLAACWEIADAP